MQPRSCGEASEKCAMCLKMSSNLSVKKQSRIVLLLILEAQAVTAWTKTYLKSVIANSISLIRTAAKTQSEIKTQASQATLLFTRKVIGASVLKRKSKKGEARLLV